MSRLLWLGVLGRLGNAVMRIESLLPRALRAHAQEDSHLQYPDHRT
jgi:hypothetical protein